jgi:hypothetical protein
MKRFDAEFCLWIPHVFSERIEKDPEHRLDQTQRYCHYSNFSVITVHSIEINQVKLHNTHSLTYSNAISHRSDQKPIEIEKKHLEKCGFEKRSLS